MQSEWGQAQQPPQWGGAPPPSQQQQQQQPAWGQAPPQWQPQPAYAQTAYAQPPYGQQQQQPFVPQLPPQQQPGAPWQQPGVGGGGGGGGGWGAGFQPPQMNDPMLNAGLSIGMDMATREINERMQTLTPGVTSLWGSLKRKFRVNNAFVLRRLGALVFPFGQKNWAQGSGVPAEDANAPDLYIPTMALVTYVLATGLVKGAWMRFDPEVLVDAFGTSVMALVVQVMCMRGFMWSLGPVAPAGVSWLDLLAYAGYQFVGVSLNLLVGVALGSSSYTVCLAWTSLSLGYVMFRSMQQVVPPPDPGQRGKRRRLYFLVACVVLQVLVMVFLGYSKELRTMAVETVGGDRISPAAIRRPAADTAPLKAASKEAAQASSSSSAAEDDDDDDEEDVAPPTPPPSKKAKATKGKKASR